MTRLLICACGEEFTPNGREVRCRSCRFAPSSNPRNKLTKADIPVIRARAEAGETVGKIAQSYDVARGTIYAVVQGRTWQPQKPREWRDIPGYEGRYKISTRGEITSVITRKQLHPRKTKGGYCIRLRDKRGHKHEHLVQRLLLIAFSPIEKADDYIALCQDDNKYNLDLTNWQWAKQSGDYAAHSKLTPQKKQAIKMQVFSDSSLRYADLAACHNISLHTIYSIMSGRR